MTINQEYDFSSAKKAFSRIGLALLAFFAATFLSQYIFAEIVDRFFPNLFAGGVTYLHKLIISFVTMYLIGVPVFYLCIKGVDTFPADVGKIGLSSLVSAFIISMTLSYVGSMLGDGVSSVIYRATDVMPITETLELISGISWEWALVFVAIIGPFFEELIFRKLIIDRTRGFGEKLSMIFSAILFALYHISVQQFFYAFFIGMLYGYIYLRTGKMIYSYVLHAAFNLFGSVIPLMLNEIVDYTKLLTAKSSEEMYKMVEENMLGYSIVSLYSLATIVMAFAGVGLLLKKIRTMRFETALFQLPKDSEATTAFVNVGVMLYITFVICYFVFTQFM